MRSLFLDQRLVDTTPPPVDPPPVDPPPVDPPPVDPDPNPPIELPEGDAFGPTGQYWAPGLLKFTDKFDVSVEVDCSWAAIDKAITDINKASLTNKARIVVRPGTLAEGNGDGSGAASSLTSAGSQKRTYPILIMPKSGFESVKVFVGKGVSLVDIHGISLAGIEFGQQGIMIRNCVNTSIGFTSVRTFNMTSNGGTGLVNCWMFEIACNETRHNYKGDRGATRLASPYTVKDCGIIGFYIAPGYRTKGDTAHNDGYQLSATGRAENTGFSFIGGVIYNASNQGLIFTETPHVQKPLVDKVLFVSGYKIMAMRHPAEGTDDSPDGTNAFWGGGEKIICKRSIVIGSTAIANKFDLVEDTRVSKATKAPVKVGKFIVDTSLDNVSKAQIDAWSQEPNAAWRKRVWGAVIPKL